MVRDPRWGRTEEAYGEDVCLAGELTAAYTTGMAGETDNGYYLTVPTLKHFCANNNEEDRGSCNAYLTPRLKREYYYAAFEIPIRKGGARSIMAAYNEINGLPAIMNGDIQRLLKDEWGLWFVVSDGGDFSQNVMAHRYTVTHSEAYKLCLDAGSGTMTDEDTLVKAAAKKALEQGRITWSDIDKAVTDAVYARIRLGQLDKTKLDDITTDVIDCEKHREINRRAALEQVTLLKNNGILPIKDKSLKTAVVGALADDCLMDWYTGYWSYETTALEGIKKEFDSVTYDSLWDIVAVKCPNGKYLCAYDDGSLRADADAAEGGALFELQDWGENWTDLFSVKYKRYVRLFDDDTLKLHNRRIFDWFTRETFNFKPYCGKTVIEEFLHHRRVAVAGDLTMTVIRQKGVTDEQLFDIEVISRGKERAEKIAAENDIVIYCVGNYPVQTAKECYDRKTLALNVQEGMTETLAAVNKNTVLALISSYPYAVTEQSDAAAAVIWSSHAGAELGSALAKTLTGENNPSGKTPITWYRSELDLPDIMDYDIESAGSTYMYFEGKPLYPFGHGLSYSTYEYSDIDIKQTDDGAVCRLKMTNASDTDGTETVQLYFTVRDSEVKRPLKKLCAFERVTLKAGESKDVTLNVSAHILSIFDVRREQMILESAEYVFFAGSSSEDIRLSQSIRMKGQSLAKRGSHFSAAMFDKIEGARLFYSAADKSEYVRATGWSGTVVYSGAELSGAKGISFRAGSMLGEREITLKAGDAEFEITLQPSDSFDDFREYTVKLPSNITGDEIVFCLKQDTSIIDISISY